MSKGCGKNVAGCFGLVVIALIVVAVAVALNYEPGGDRTKQTTAPAHTIAAVQDESGGDWTKQTTAPAHTIAAVQDESGGDWTKQTTAPAHTIAAVQDVSFQNGRRLAYRIRIPGHYSEAEILQIAKWIASTKHTTKDQVNALAFWFYLPGTPIDGSLAADAVVFWAPLGEVGECGRCGDRRLCNFSL